MWYIIGEGSPIETDVLRNAISKAEMSDSVVLFGRKDNPYPYIAEADILVSTSISETFSYVVFEAKSLGVPIVCSDFGTAPEILPENEGIITPIDKMAMVIYSLYSDSTKLEVYRSNLSDYKYNNEQVLNTF